MTKRLSRPKMAVFLILSAIVCSVTSFVTAPIRATPPAHPRSQPLRTIIIDPGHGGFDPGCKGLFSMEKDVTLSISLKLGKAIQEAYPEMKIVFTRTTDIMPGNMPTLGAGLHYRAAVANKAHGDLYICIHANSDGHSPGRYLAKRVIGHKWVGKGKKRRRRPIYESYWVTNTRIGTASYIWKADRSGFKGQAINQRDTDTDSTGVENMGDSTGTAFDMTSPEAIIQAQLYEKKYFANSALFATYVEEEFVKAGRVSEGVLQRDVGIRVLQETGMPSVLIETGYLTNKEEEIYLNSENGQAEVVQNIMDALKKYKDSLEGNHTGGGDSSTGAGGGLRR